MVQQRIIKDRIVSDGIQRDRLGYPLSEIKPVNPSMPSIKFNELVITKKTNKETIYEVNSEI